MQQRALEVPDAKTVRVPEAAAEGVEFAFEAQSSKNVEPLIVFKSHRICKTSNANNAYHAHMHTDGKGARTTLSASVDGCIPFIHPYSLEAPLLQRKRHSHSSWACANNADPEMLLLVQGSCARVSGMLVRSAHM